MFYGVICEDFTQVAFFLLGSKNQLLPCFVGGQGMETIWYVLITQLS